MTHALRHKSWRWLVLALPLASEGALLAPSHALAQPEANDESSAPSTPGKPKKRAPQGRPTRASKRAGAAGASARRSKSRTLTARQQARGGADPSGSAPADHRDSGAADHPHAHGERARAGATADQRDSDSADHADARTGRPATADTPHEPGAKDARGRAAAANGIAAPDPSQANTGTAAPASAALGGIHREGDTEIKTMEFSGLDIEGQLKSPQMLYFLKRVRAEFEQPRLPHRSFMPELARSKNEADF
jgi:hypothetical protein